MTWEFMECHECLHDDRVQVTVVRDYSGSEPVDIHYWTCGNCGTVHSAGLLVRETVLF